MSLDPMRFKPGLGTSLNSAQNIKSRFASQKAGEGGTAGIKNPTGNTAAANLSQKSSVSSANWNSANGSVFSLKNTGETGSVTKSSSARTGGSSGVKDPKYVSSGHNNKMKMEQEHRRSLLSREAAFGEYGYTRELGATGSTRRAAYREEARNEAVWQSINQKLTQPPEKDFLDKINDVAATVTGAATALGGVAELASGIMGLFKKGGNGSSEGATTKGSTKPSGNGSSAAQKTGNQSIQKMENATTSSELNGAIEGAKQDVSKIDENINTTKSDKANLKAKSSQLKQKAKKEEKDVSTAEKNVKSHQKNAASFQKQADVAENAMKSKQAQIDNNTQTINKNKTTISNNNTTITNNKKQIGTLEQQIEQLKASNEKGQNSAQIAQLEQQKAQLEKQNNKLEQENKQLTTERDQKKDQMEKAKQSADQETKLAQDGEKQVQKEKQEAADAKKAVTDNDAAIQAKDEEIAGMKQEKSTINNAIDEQEDRYKNLKKDEIKKQDEQKNK